MRCWHRRQRPQLRGWPCSRLLVAAYSTLSRSLTQIQLALVLVLALALVLPLLLAA